MSLAMPFMLVNDAGAIHLEIESVTPIDGSAA